MAVVVVLPAPCRPAIRMTAGGCVARSMSDTPAPIVAVSSRCTMPTSACPGESEPATSAPSALSLTRAMKSRTTGSATSASSSAMRTSRSISCTLASVMRAWPRIVLTRRLMRSVREEAMAVGRPGGPEPRHYTVRMILSFGSAAPVLAIPSAAALAGYGAAAVLAGPAGAASEPAADAASAASRRRVRAALVFGWLAHALAIVADVSGAGSAVAGARFGFAPALSATLWLVLAVHAVETRFLPQPAVRRTLAALGMAVVALAWRYPGEPTAHAGSPWAPLHWVLGIVSYGLFGAAVLHALLLDSADRRMRPQAHAAGAVPPPARAPGLPLLALERLTFRFVEAGFAVLSATLVLGWWFSDPWRWDHKTVFSVLAWLLFATLVAGRHAFGWRGRAATRWLYAGAALLMLAYVGSRFVLEVVLHRSASGT